MPEKLESPVPDPLLIQNTKKAGGAGWKQRKIRRANGGKKHKSEPKRLRFTRETYVRNAETKYLRSALFCFRQIGSVHAVDCRDPQELHPPYKKDFTRGPLMMRGPRASSFYRMFIERLR